MEKIEFKTLGYKMTQCMAEKSKEKDSSFIELPASWAGKNVVVILTDDLK
ncbi:MAG: hypothetical protein IMZ64_06690 [Bacteroidetes bacterium]|nr:hypothetical protein [Bacteroidota bacterium]